MSVLDRNCHCLAATLVEWPAVSRRAFFFQAKMSMRVRADASAHGCELVCLVPPTGMEHVEAIASNLEKMPPKSTYFYPKLLSGLVLNPLR